MGLDLYVMSDGSRSVTNMEGMHTIWWRSPRNVAGGSIKDLKLVINLLLFPKLKTTSVLITSL